MDLATVPGFGPTLSRRASVHFGGNLNLMLSTNPYALTEVAGIGFRHADAAALHFGVRKTDPRRQAAAALYVLSEAENDGHTALPIAMFGQRMAEALGEAVGGCDFDDPRVVERDGLISRRVTLEAEERAALLVKATLAHPCPEGLPTQVEGLANDQAQALAVIQRANIFCLLGSPGTGKTTLIKSIIRSNPDVRIALCAPTGKAAKRMEEATGTPSRTVHRLLEAGFDERTRKFRFRRNGANPISGGLVVCDESSMLDIRLFASLLEALAPNCRLLLVGDIYQLPSVGPGRVLADLTRRGAVPNVELTELKRHDPDLMIARNCAAIKAGRAPTIANAESKDFFFIDKASDAAIANEVVELVARRLPAKYGIDANREVVVLTALRERGELSAKELNVKLRAALNEGAQGEFAPGDRVIQLSNDYKLDVMNGDLGTVIRRDGRNLMVRFDTPERIVTEERPDNAFHLAYAWALTVHKSQGSEWPWVVIPVHESQGAMVPDRAWIYTAISRAKVGCVLVGNRNVMQAIINRVRPQERCTRLAGLLA
jgi:exodeoxyribonuclease V alpha subunit